MLKARQRLGKYRIQRSIGQGGFATVYRAFDTIEGVPVALKIPHPHLVTPEMLEGFRSEVRLTAQLDHPNILAIKNASFIDELFVIACPLAECTLADRMRRRISAKNAIGYIEQALEALAYAHRHRIIHCDVKPENLLLFSNNQVRLADFGIAKIALKTIKASGSGTVGYVAPEQAMGRPSPRSDVFSMGLVIYRMLSGHLPEWPYEWPLPGFDRLKRTSHPDLVNLLRRATEVDQRYRYADAAQMLAAFRKLRPRIQGLAIARRRAVRSQTSPGRDWKSVRMKQFQRDFGRALAADHHCDHCGMPVSESMRACPWCRHRRRVHEGETGFPARCPRCRRGVKLDWKFCPWCFGKSIGPKSKRDYTDVRYDQDTCKNDACGRKEQMPFMHYCPWCNRRAAEKWSLPGSEERCPKCGWGATSEYWDGCPWCASGLKRA